MKTNLPRNNDEIVATLVSIVDEISHLKDDMNHCQKAITLHAEEARESNKIMSHTVNDLKFSVTHLQNSVEAMEKSLKQLMEFSASILTITSFVGKTLKVVALLVTIIGGIMAFKGLFF